MTQMMMGMERSMGVPGMTGGVSPGMMMGAGTINMMMIPRCTMKMEKCDGGMRMSCMCKVEPMQNGVTMTWTSKDEQTCRMIQSCCDPMMTMMDCGCTCCMCMNATPVCCGTCC